MVRVASAKPATIGATPIVPSRYVGMKAVSPITTAPMASPMIEVDQTIRRPSSGSESTGSAARRSIATNTTSSTAPPISTARLIGESHVHALPPSSTPSSRSTSASVSTVAPA